MSVLVHRVHKRYTFKSQGGEALADRTSLTATLFLNKVHVSSQESE
jgi:hypothetical protein